jgi:hypothetical protein
MNRSRIIRPVVTLAAAALAVALGTTGLAVAGVDLPDPAAEAFENAGITLPNQAGGGQSGEHARSEAVHAVIEETPPSERGCAFGQSVATAASGKTPSEHACGQDAEDRKAKAKSENSSHSNFGHETAERAKDQKDATVEDRKRFGQDTADLAKELGGAPNGADQREETPPAGGTTGPPEGTPNGPPEGTPNGPGTAPILEDTPNGPPEGTPSGRP